MITYSKEIMEKFQEIDNKYKFLGLIDKWNLAEGDRVLRTNYDLNDKSIVFDIGGFCGTWATDIFCMHGSNILIFEPVPHFYDTIKYKFSNNNKVKLFNYGLSESDQTIEMEVKGDASSIYKNTGGNFIEVKMVDIANHLSEYEKIDLMKINIEGGEYDLLDRIIELDATNKIENIQVQFHNFVPDCKNRRNNIRDKLKLTHEITYEFEFVWENWKKK